MFRKMRRERQALPEKDIIQILEKGQTGVLAVCGDDGYPYTVPLNYVFQDGKVYFHCAATGHKIDSIGRSDKVSFCVVERDKVIPEKLATEYRSVVIFGRAKVLSDPEQKRFALTCLNAKYASEYSEAGRKEIERYGDRVGVVVIEIAHMTGKRGLYTGDRVGVSPEDIRLWLDEKYRDWKVICLEETDSTNSEAKRRILAGDVTGNAVILADRQTQGRGRRGNSFYSPAGTGLYMSFVTYPEKSLRDSLILTVAAAVAVTRTIEKFSSDKPAIKWVNDVFIGTKKVCGILAESVANPEDGSVKAIITGIGVNLGTATEDFPEELRGIAGSVFPENASRSRFAAELIRQFATAAEETDRGELLREYKEKSLVLGKIVGYVKNGVHFTGKAVDINDEGSLIVLLPDGTRDVLLSGEISIEKSYLVK